MAAHFAVPPSYHFPPPPPSQPSFTSTSLFFDSSSNIGTHDATLRAALSTLITASHILHNHSVVDAYGHVSLRNPSNPSTFFLPRNVAPALLKSGTDIVEYHVSDASPVLGQGAAPHGYVERAIHAAVLKRWPGINCVLHAHDPEVTAWSLVIGEDDNEEDMKKEHGLAAVSHMSGFIGTSVPVWDIGRVYDERVAMGRGEEARDFLVKDMALGASLAKAFGRGEGSGGVNALSKDYRQEMAIRSGATSGTVSPATITSDGQKPLPQSPERAQSQQQQPQAQTIPPHKVVLMRSHGYTTVASTLQELVYQGIYLQSNAKLQKAASALACEAGAGKNRIHFLSARECADSSGMGAKSGSRAWELWEREVKVNKLYENKLDFEDEEAEEEERRRREAVQRMGKRDSIASVQSNRGPSVSHPHGHSNLTPVVARALDKEDGRMSGENSRRGSWLQNVLGDKSSSGSMLPTMF